MIRVKHSSGNDYYRSEELCTYATVWNRALETKGGIRFYDGELSVVGDFRLGDQPDELLMVSYPHNDKKALLDAAERHEAEIRAAIVSAMKIEPERTLFTVDLAGGEVKVLQKEHFNRYSSLAKPSDELFTFDNPDPKVGFPRLYLHEKNQKLSEAYGGVFRVLAKVSRFTFPPLEAPTSDGEQFTYMLYNSWANFEFTPEIPNLHGLFWPTRIDCETPANLDVSALDKFLTDIGIDDLIFKDGMIVVPESDETEEPVEEEEWEDVDMPLFDFGSNETRNEKEDLRDSIWQMIENKGYFNIADAFVVGLERVLGMVPISNKIIPANIDFPGLVRKLCIYQRVFFVIPLGDQGGRLAEILDLDETSMIICTDETYPKHNTPMLPAPEY